jgi:hypothetical protein
LGSVITPPSRLAGDEGLRAEAVGKGLAAAGDAQGDSGRHATAVAATTTIIIIMRRRSGTSVSRPTALNRPRTAHRYRHRHPRIREKRRISRMR